MTTLTEPTTHTLDVPGAVLTYDVRRADSDAPPCSSSDRRWARAGSAHWPATSPIAPS